jgi:hypothetical protein
MSFLTVALIVVFIWIISKIRISFYDDPIEIRETLVDDILATRKQKREFIEDSRKDWYENNSDTWR